MFVLKFVAIMDRLSKIFKNCASSVCVQTNAPRARWGSTPIPFDITVETGDELSVTDAKREEG
jgi:hypothetical protein